MKGEEGGRSLRILCGGGIGGGEGGDWREWIVYL